jgi:hypothetical protein
MELLKDALKTENMEHLLEESENGKRELLKGAASVPRARVQGVEISGETAKILLSKPRERGIGQRLDGEYEILEINMQTEQGYTAKIRNVTTNQIFEAHVNYDDLTKEDILTLFTSAREKRTIKLNVNIWMVGDRIARSSVMRAEPKESASSSR